MLELNLNGREIRNSKSLHFIDLITSGMQTLKHGSLVPGTRLCTNLVAVLQSAINLARYHARGEGDDEIDITAELLRKVVDNRTQYKNAIKRIDGLSESARAHDAGWIAD